jgi:8-oxo-dGTP pyrophosphatase MutT (NUDIX family)
MSVSKTELLNVVNDNDEIVGVEDRRKIHKDGLLHREVNVWFYTPEHELVFQHRAKDKDTFPDLLDATVGGHVDMGDSYPTAATREAEEETGLKIRVEDLMPLEKLKLKTFDSATGNTNYAFRTRYAYLFKDDLADLRIEKGKAVGFETYPIDLILSADEEFKKRFVPSVFDPQVLESFRRISTL